MNEPTVADLLERIVATLAEPATEPDLTVGQAVWRLYQAWSETWEALVLRPVGGGREAFDAVYEASRHGLHVRELAVGDPDSAPAEPVGAWDVPVTFADETVAVFTARPRAGAPAASLAPLSQVAQGVGLLLVDLAQRRRMGRELGHLRALVDLNTALWLHRDEQALLASAAASLREAWGLECVRIYARARTADAWTLAAQATLPGARRVGLDTLPPSWVDRLRRDPQPAVIRLALAAWLVPVTDDDGPLGAVVLDNAITGGPLRRQDELVQAVRALATAWSRLPASPAPVDASDAPSPPLADRLAQTLGDAAGKEAQLVVWRVLGARARMRRRGAVGEDPALALERLVAPRHRLVTGDAHTFAATLCGVGPEVARETAERGIAALSRTWRCVAAVTGASRGEAPAAAAARALALVDEAATMHDGAVLAQGDRWRRGPGGGLWLAQGAVLRPEVHRLDLPDDSVALTRTETRLLWALATTAGPLTAGALVRRVWPGDPTMGVMNLYPHVHELRRRLARAWPDGLRVVTVRGHGYALAAEGAAGERPAAGSPPA